MAKKQKDKKKKLRSLILLLLLTVVMLSTATYAWFTANKAVSINDINVHIATTSGLQISTNATSWKTAITNTDITTGAYTGHTNMLPTVLEPVSTDGTVANGKMNMFLGTLAAGTEAGTIGTLALTAEASPETAGSNGKFVAFDIFLKTEQDETIYLEPGSGVTVTGNEADKGLQYATRYAFVVEGNAAATANTSTIVALNSGTSSIIVEPNFEKHKASGVTWAAQYYGIDNLVADTETNPVNSKVAYDGVKAAITDEIAIAETNATDNSTYFASVTTKETPTNYDGNWSDDYVELFDVSGGVTKVRVYMWVEGQDVDCENNASGAYLTYKINLTTNSSANPTEETNTNTEEPEETENETPEEP